MAGDIEVDGTPDQAGRRGRRPRARDAILRRAAELASLDGLDDVSIGRLADSMQMSKSGLYAHFGSKQDLQMATIECAWRVFAEHVLDPTDGGLEALVDRWIAYYEQEVFPGGCLFVTAGLEFANREGPVRDALAAAIERQVAALEEAIRGAARGRDIDAGQLAFELHAVLTSGNHRFRMNRDPRTFARTRAAAHRLAGSVAP